MSKNLRTFFIRPMPHQERLPTPLQNAYIACTVHVSRTDNNSEVVRHILLDTYTGLMSATKDSKFEAELATIQAALLLHILLLFDGDIQYRSVAESYLDALRDKVLRLQRRGPDEIPENVTSSPYAKWLFMENVRRTILASTFVECVYMNSRDGIANTVPFLSMLPITVSGRLWRAPSESEWTKQSKAVPLTVLPYGEALGWWSEDAAQGRLDTLQHLLYLACKGFSGVQL